MRCRQSVSILGSQLTYLHQKPVTALQPIQPATEDLIAPTLVPPVAFIASGHLNIGDGCDLVGRGMLSAECRRTPRRHLPELHDANPALYLRGAGTIDSSALA